MGVDDIVRTIDDDPGSRALVCIDKEFIIEGRSRSESDSCFVINVPDGSRMLVNVEVQTTRNTGRKMLELRMY